MATKTFGKLPKTNQDFIDEIHKLADDKFPLSVTSANGKLLNVSYETTWQEGGTTPVETIDESGNTVIDYEGSYSKHKLSAAQIKKIDAYIEKNIEA